MKKQHKLEIFGLPDNFCVKLKHIFIKSRYLYLQKPLVDNAFSCCWTVSEFYSLETRKIL